MRHQYRELQKQEMPWLNPKAIPVSAGECSPAGAIVDAEGTITFVNNFLLSLIGWERRNWKAIISGIVSVFNPKKNEKAF